jgi:hypothetical protein
MPVELDDAAELTDLIRDVDHQVRRHSRRSAVAARAKGTSHENRGRSLAVLYSFLMVAAVAAVLVAHFGPFAIRERRLSVEETSHEIKKAVEFGVRLVETHKSRTGALPPNVAAVGLAATDGWSYQAIGAGHYRLSLRFGGQIGTFDSSVGDLVVAPGQGRQ